MTHRLLLREDSRSFTRVSSYCRIRPYLYFSMQSELERTQEGIKGFESDVREIVEGLRREIKRKPAFI